MGGYVYILLCSNETYYTGSTKDLERRINQHKAGIGANYTKKHSPTELVYYEFYDRVDVAFEREHKIKKWSRAKKLALINGEFDLLPSLAKKIFRKVD